MADSTSLKSVEESDESKASVTMADSALPKSIEELEESKRNSYSFKYVEESEEPKADSFSVESAKEPDEPKPSECDKLNEDDKEPESSDDFLDLLAEADSRDRNESDENDENDDEEVPSPESNLEQEESNELGENMETTALGDEALDKDDEIDIDEDFAQRFKMNEDEEPAIAEDFSVNENLITEVVSLAPIENIEPSEKISSSESEKLSKDVDDSMKIVEPANSFTDAPLQNSKFGQMNDKLNEEYKELSKYGVPKELWENLNKKIQNIVMDFLPPSENNKNLSTEENEGSLKTITESETTDSVKSGDQSQLDDTELMDVKDSSDKVVENEKKTESESKIKEKSLNNDLIELVESSSDSEDAGSKISQPSIMDDSNMTESPAVLTKAGDEKKKKMEVKFSSTTTKKLEDKKASVTPMEVLNLSSDDEETSLANTSSELDSVNETVKRAKDDSPHKSKSVCVNLKCTSKSNVPFIQCHIFMLGMYQVKRTRKMEHPIICQTCYDSAISDVENLVSKLRSGSPLIQSTFQKNEDHIEVLGSDSEDEEKTDEFIPLPGYNSLSADELEFITENLPDMMEHVTKKFKFDEQIKMSNKVIDDLADKLEEDAMKLNEEYDETQKNFLRIKDTLYQSVTISRSSLPELLIPLDSEEFEDNFEDLSTVENMSLEEIASTFVPPVGVNKYEPLKVGDTVYTVKHSIFGAWISATVVNISPVGSPMANGMPLTFSLMTIKFQKAGRKAVKQVTGRQVAYSTPSEFLYSIGTRVIALFKDNGAMPSFKKDSFYSGIIAETPSVTNKYRYLIFFDDGYSQYVIHNNILPVSESSDKVWEDVHPESRDFMKKYLLSYPDRPMVHFEIGHNMKVENNGVWWNAVVKVIDASLALMQFDKSNKLEWIYRGSTRLNLLYQQLQAADRRAHAFGKQRISRTTNHTLYNMNMPYVEYTRSSNDNYETVVNENETIEAVVEKTTPKSFRAVAKKSTSAPIAVKEEDLTPEVMETGGVVKSRVVYYSPKQWIHPKKMVPHECNPGCLNRKTPSLASLRTYHPLTKPLLSAWERLLIKNKYKRTVMYRAPCGRRLRNIQEVHKYLCMTNSEMSVDLFDFDYRVHCLAEFVATSCYVKKADISHGVEAMAVPCVNYYDHSLPDFWAYSTKRIATEGVELNLNEDFLCSCDCIDDCQDKTKCQCWQLTYEGTRYIGLSDENVGYEYKRLYEQVPTGIYECNSRCKCAATCLNRVVQHPLQLKLQVFKTYDKGWGIRALNDIPRGSFICVYAGNLLTDAAANDGGKKHEGDKYLADLDYIEIVEKLKESYESDIPEEDKILDKENIAKRKDSTDTKGNDNNEDEDEDEDDDPNDVSKLKSSNQDDSDEEFNPAVFCNVARKEIKTRLRAKQLQNQALSKNNAESTKNCNDKNSPPDNTINSENDNNKVRSNESEINEFSENSEKPLDTKSDDFITISDDEDVLREPSRFAAPEGCSSEDYVPKHRSVRSFYGSVDDCYIMDARITGNIGRYLNHSCSPNVFVQNVFVDTHDPRLPWVAFFSLEHIRTGTELTWNYNYDIGSVPGKVIYCKCGSNNCRGRLL